MAEAIRVEGIRELQRAFGAADKALRADLKDSLEEAAAPVRTDAQALATTITHMTTAPWTRMRIGTVSQSVVYVAPVERGLKTRGDDRRRRPRFKDVLGPRMDLALERNRRKVVDRIELMLVEVAKVWERVGR